MSILQTIVEHKRDELAARKPGMRVSALAQTELYGRKTRSLTGSLRLAESIAIIAEFKRTSPSGGALRSDLSPDGVCRTYADNGAAGISVLTDERFFSGTNEDLLRVRAAVELPILRKDFVIDEYQLHEAKALGADAVLLIAAILDRPQLSDLHDAARELGLEALVELYGEAEIDLLDLDRMRLIGINNRDLKSFSVDLNRTVMMARHFGTMPEITLVSESGIRGPDDLKKLLSGGVRAALIGEYLMKAPSPGDALRDLLKGTERETAR